MLQIVVANAQALRNVAAKVRVDHVTDSHEVLKDGASRRGSEIDAHASFVAIERLEENTVFTVLERHHVASDVPTNARVFDLDDVSTEIRQLDRAKRPRPVLLNGQDTDVFE